MDIGTMRGKLSVIAEKASSRALSLKGCLQSAFASFSQHEYTMRDGAMLLVTAIVLGVLFKVVASDTFTIGYDDYRLKPAEALIDIDMLQNEMIRKGESMPVADQSVGASCSE